MTSKIFPIGSKINLINNKLPIDGQNIGTII